MHSLSDDRNLEEYENNNFLATDRTKCVTFINLMPSVGHVLKIPDSKVLVVEAAELP